MESRYSSMLENGVRVVLPNFGYTNKEISLIFLDHNILHTNFELDKLLKVLLMDRHGSHVGLEFMLKVTAHNILFVFGPWTSYSCSLTSRIWCIPSVQAFGQEGASTCYA
jgi:hypothetical protein